jgi:hypothetical protein
VVADEARPVTELDGIFMLANCDHVLDPSPTFNTNVSVANTNSPSGIIGLFELKALLVPLFI